jgi:hypothetical protein
MSEQPYAYDPATGAPLYAPSHAADLPVHEQQLGAATEGSPALDPSRPCNMTAGDLFMSLNGFDEIAVAQRFGAPIAALREDATTLGRALAFVDQRRKGLKDSEAYDAAMGLTIHVVSHEYFQPEPKADDPAAASAEGNGEPSTSSTPA